jgi:polyhydroxybutyrate depolymerase
VVAWAVLMVSVPGALAAGPCAAAPAAGSRGTHIVFGARRRFFQLHVPPQVPAGARLPLVLALHGAGGSGTQMERYSGFSNQADLHGFLVVYPSSAGPKWNITGARAGADDVGFISQVLTDVEQSVCVDTSRVFAAGISNGAGMSARLGCALSEQILAIAPVEGDYDDEPPCRNSAPLSVLEIHGTADQIAPYFGHKGRASAQGVPPFVKGWVHRDSCSTVAVMRALAARAFAFMWPGCDGSSVEHIRIQGGGHQWPGASPPDPGPPSTICAACTIWSFFAGLQPRAGSYTGGAGLPG